MSNRQNIPGVDTVDVESLTQAIGSVRHHLKAAPPHVRDQFERIAVAAGLNDDVIRVAVYTAQFDDAQHVSGGTTFGAVNDRALLAARAAQAKGDVEVRRLLSTWTMDPDEVHGH